MSQNSGTCSSLLPARARFSTQEKVVHPKTRRDGHLSRATLALLTVASPGGPYLRFGADATRVRRDARFSYLTVQPLACASRRMSDPLSVDCGCREEFQNHLVVASEHGRQTMATCG
ncbi:hypothetical protein MTO96_014516 [Rhipicephalus appendiculatus]